MNATGIYCALNAVLYLLFGAWCVMKPEYTSTAIGFSLIGDQGFAEYMAVYGGLQIGIGVFYAAAFLTLAMQPAALLFSVCLYGGLVLARSIAILTHGNSIGFGWYYFVLEITLWLAALLLRLRC